MRDNSAEEGKTFIKLKVDDLAPSIGRWIENHKGELLGQVKDIIYRASTPEFIILHCPHLLLDSNRYFAVSADPAVVKVNADGEVVMHLDKEVLHIVLGICAENFPEKSSKLQCRVFELY